MNKLLLLLPAFLSQLLVIKTVDCKTQYGPCENEDIQLASRFVGKNIFLVSDLVVGETLQANFKNNRVFVHRQLLHTLSLVIEKRKAALAIRKEKLTRGLFLISSDGMTLAFDNARSALPTVNLSEDYPTPVVGEKVSAEIASASKILGLVKKVENIFDGQLDKEGLSVTISLGKNVKVIFPKDGNPQVLVGALQLILEQAKMKNKIPEVIDLRYKNPVLRY